MVSLVENRFDDAIALEIGGHVAALIPGEALKAGGQKASEAIRQALLPFITSIRMKCGVSQALTNLYDSRHAFTQAAAAIRNGLQRQADEMIFFFEDYILDQLLANAVGETPTRFFRPEGLKRLRQHDLASQVSYVETLRVYLESNMSLSKTASELMLHRSSLIDRLARIDQLLDADLSDPDTRLALRIILRAEQMKPDD